MLRGRLLSETSLGMLGRLGHRGAPGVLEAWWPNGSCPLQRQAGVMGGL